jgi:hypothetical protein
MEKIEKGIAKFDYNTVLLEEYVSEATKTDKTNIEDVSEKVKEIVKMRRKIEAQGKSFRDANTEENRKISADERKFTEILIPLEEEFKQLIEDNKKKLIMEARKELLPMKKEQLELLQDLKAGHIKDDEILSMSDEEWVRFYQNAMEENTREKLAKEKRAEYEANIEEREAEIAEKSRLDGIAEQKAKEKAKAGRAKADAGKKKLAEAEEKERLAKDNAYQTFLKKNGFRKETDIVQKGEEGLRLYRLVDTFKN